MARRDESERMWDEHDWERFMREQDRRTDKYMELMEKYLDHPDRDRIIAREMGWTHLEEALDEIEEEDLLECLGEEIEEEAEWEEEATGEGGGEGERPFQPHPLYVRMLELESWLDGVVQGEWKGLPVAVRVLTSLALAQAKVAAGLTDDDVDEPAMTVAYLKRGLKNLTDAMDQCDDLAATLKLSDAERAGLRGRLFAIRDGIICLMGDYRGEWRRRAGGS
jgi:hypothetical protein